MHRREQQQWRRKGANGIVTAGERQRRKLRVADLQMLVAEQGVAANEKVIHPAFDRAAEQDAKSFGSDSADRALNFILQF